MPSKEKAVVTFKNIQNKMRFPFVIYADFECLTTELERDD